MPVDKFHQVSGRGPSFNLAIGSNDFREFCLFADNALEARSVGEKDCNAFTGVEVLLEVVIHLVDYCRQYPA